MTSWLFADRGCTCGVAPAKAKETAPSGQAPDILPTYDFKDKYVLLEELGRGGVGTVYRVRDVADDRQYALKTLQPEFLTERSALKRFEHEARAARSLSHPNLVRVHEYGRTADGVPFIVMSFVNGNSLGDVLRDEMYLAPSRVVEIFIQACDALGYAHEHGVVHRDIKPGNIILERGDANRPLFGDFVKIVDFGIAKVMPGYTGDTSELTQTGEIFGSPLYMSPEQCTGARIDARSDIYSLGCVMYECLTGINPFAADNPVQTILKQLHDDPPSFKKACPTLRIPAALETVVMRALAKNPADRYQSMKDISCDLQLIKEGKTPPAAKERTIAKVAPTAAFIQRNRVGLLLLVANLSIGGFVVWFVLSKTQPPPQPQAPAPSHAASEDYYSSVSLHGVDEDAVLNKVLTDKSNKPIDAAILNGPPFALQPLSAAQTPWVLQFPERVSLGYIIQSRSTLSAIGKIEIAQPAPICLQVGSNLRHYPELFKRFRPDEIRVLKFPAGFTGNVLRNIQHLTGLQELWMVGAALSGDECKLLQSFHDLRVLDVSSAHVTDELLPVLDSLPKLTMLNIDGTNISGKALSRASLLRRLKVLHAGNLTDISPVLHALTATSIHSLSVSADHLQDSDLQAISKIRTLQSLSIGLNKGLSKAALQNLADLPFLAILKVDGCNLGFDELASLRSLRHLRVLKVDKRLDTPELQAALPGVSIDFDPY